MVLGQGGKNGGYGGIPHGFLSVEKRERRRTHAGASGKMPGMEGCQTRLAEGVPGGAGFSRRSGEAEDECPAGGAFLSAAEEGIPARAPTPARTWRATGVFISTAYVRGRLPAGISSPGLRMWISTLRLAAWASRSPLMETTGREAPQARMYNLHSPFGRVRAMPLSFSHWRTALARIRESTALYSSEPKLSV